MATINVVTSDDPALGRGALGVDQQLEMPNTSAFQWISEPVSVEDSEGNARVFIGTSGAERGSWLEEWSQPGGSGAPYVLHRYFMGFYDETPSAYDKRDDEYRDDHCPASFAIRAGYKAVVFWAGHAADNKINYRISEQLVGEVPAGQLVFGPIQTFEIAADERVTYPTVLLRDGSDTIYMVARTGWVYNAWSLIEFPDWATGTPTQTTLFHSPPLAGLPGQTYGAARIYGDDLYFFNTDHPAYAAATESKIWYFQIDLTTGAIDMADGTNIANLDGTNLPMSQDSGDSNVMEVIHTSAGDMKCWGWDVGYTSAPELVFFDAEIADVADTGWYKHIRYNGSAWVETSIVQMGHMLSAFDGAYFPSIQFDPDFPWRVLAVTSTGTGEGTNQAVIYSTPDNGATWAEGDTVDTLSVSWATDLEPEALSRCYTVRTIDGTRLFDSFGTVIIDYVQYWQGWQQRVLPLPLSSACVVATQDREAIDFGLRHEAKSPEAGLRLPGLSGHYILGEDVALPTPLQGIRMEVDATMPDWQPGSEIALLSKEASGTNREVRIVLGATGKFAVWYSEDGSVAEYVYTVKENTFDAGARVQVAVDWIPDTEHPTEAAPTTAWFFEVSYRFRDDQAWVPFESLSVQPGKSVFVGTSPWEIGSRWGGTTNLGEATYHRASVLTPGGDLITEWRAGMSTAQGIQDDVLGNTWTELNRDQAIVSPVITTLKTASIYDPVDNKISAGFDSTAASSDVNYLQFTSSDTNPHITAVGPVDADIPIVFLPKGDSPLRVYGDSPALQGWAGSGNADLDLQTQASGRVMHNNSFIDDSDVDSVTGHAVMPRRDITVTGNTPANSIIRYTFFTCKRIVAVSDITVHVATAAVGTTSAWVGLYEEEANGDITLVGTTANDTSIFSSVGISTTALLAPVNLEIGKRYAMALLYVGTSTPAALAGAVYAVSAVSSLPPRLCGYTNGATLPASVVEASILDTGNQYWGLLSP